LLDDVVAPHPTNVNRANDVLELIFGSKDVSRTVAADAATKTGLDPALLKKMQPILDMVVAGYMTKQRPTGGSAQPSTGSGGLGDLLGGPLRGRCPAQTGGSGLASMIDVNGNGNPLDDILRMASKAIR